MGLGVKKRDRGGEGGEQIHVCWLPPKPQGCRKIATGIINHSNRFIHPVFTSLYHFHPFVRKTNLFLLF